jgi:hypothetical protein
MRLRLRITGEGLKLTGSSRGSAAIPVLPPPSAQALLVTDNGDSLVTDQNEPLAMEPPHGQ